MYDVADVGAELQRRCCDRGRGPRIVTKPGFNEFALGLGEVSVVGEKFVGKVCFSAISRRGGPLPYKTAFLAQNQVVD
jgi:hypothetical protein